MSEPNLTGDEKKSQTIAEGREKEKQKQTCGED